MLVILLVWMKWKIETPSKMSTMPVKGTKGCRFLGDALYGVPIHQRRQTVLTPVTNSTSTSSGANSTRKSTSSVSKMRVPERCYSSFKIALGSYAYCPSCRRGLRIRPPRSSLQFDLTLYNIEPLLTPRFRSIVLNKRFYQRRRSETRVRSALRFVVRWLSLVHRRCSSFGRRQLSKLQP